MYRFFSILKSLSIGTMLCLSLAANAETIFKIITLQHHFASDLLPAIEPMVGPDGTATGINNQLILRASPERMLEIEAIITQLDVARINRKITVATEQTANSTRENTQASGAIKVGKVTVANDRRSSPSTGRVEVERNNSNNSQKTTQFIQVIDGEQAFIRVGQQIPFTYEWISLTKRYAHIERVTEWREITTGFSVRPRTIGNMVELEIAPTISRADGQGRVNFQDLSTITRVRLGDWLELGDITQQNDEVSRKILSVFRAQHSENTRLKVKVE